MGRRKLTTGTRYSTSMIGCSVCLEDVPKDEIETCQDCGNRGCPDCMEDHACVDDGTARARDEQDDDGDDQVGRDFGNFEDRERGS